MSIFALPPGMRTDGNSFGPFQEKTHSQEICFLFQYVDGAIRADLYTRQFAADPWQEKAPFFADQIFVQLGDDSTLLSNMDHKTITEIMSSIGSSRRRLHMTGGSYEGWPMRPSLIIVPNEPSPPKSRVLGLTDIINT